MHEIEWHAALPLTNHALRIRSRFRTSVTQMVQDIGKTVRAVFISCLMPWKRIEPMNQRTEFVLRAMQTDNFRELCQEYGISPKTGYKWRERFLNYGLKGMQELSRRPKNSPGGLEEEAVCEIVRLKERHRHWGPRKIRKVYERLHQEVPSESSFKRVLERAGLVEP